MPPVLDAPLVVGNIADGELVAHTVAEYGVRCGGALRRVQGSRRVHGTARALLRQQRRRHERAARCAAEAGVARFVFSSTCAVYGTPTELPVSEDHPLRPESPYGESKRMVEQMLNWYDACHGLRSVSMRYFNAAGASADNRIGEDWTVTLNLVPLVMKAALGRVPHISVYGTDYPTADGTAIRDYVHVNDLAEGHVRALDYLENGGSSTVVNLGTGEGSSVRQVIDTARRVSGVDIPVIETGRRAGDPVGRVWRQPTRG